MKDFYTYLNNELPGINKFLMSEARNLDGLVRDVALHVLDAPGKRIRPVLTILMARALNCTQDDLLPMACSLEMLHSATLLHDDILDQAELRRGNKAAHLVFGSNETILAGDVLLALANKLGAGYGKPRINYLLAEGIMATAEGEIMEIALASKPRIDREAYMDVIIGKTARLIETACRCGAVLATDDRAIEDAAGDYGLNLGIAFQLVDDALDYASAPDDTGKPEGGDLKEGKVTLPLIFLLESMEGGECESILAGMRKNTLSASERSEVLRKVREGGFVDRTRAVAQDYVSKALKSLEAIPDCNEKDVLLQAAEFVLTRQK